MEILRRFSASALERFKGLLKTLPELKLRDNDQASQREYACELKACDAVFYICCFVASLSPGNFAA